MRMFFIMTVAAMLSFTFNVFAASSVGQEDPSVRAICQVQKCYECCMANPEQYIKVVDNAKEPETKKTRDAQVTK